MLEAKTRSALTSGILFSLSIYSLNLSAATLPCAGSEEQIATQTSKRLHAERTDIESKLGGQYGTRLKVVKNALGAALVQIRSLVQGARNSSDIVLADSYLNRLRSFGAAKVDLNKVLHLSEEIKLRVSQNDGSRALSKKQRALLFEDLKNSDGLSSQNAGALAAFAVPVVKCTRAGIRATAALFYGGRVGLGGAKCEQSDGRAAWFVTPTSGILSGGEGSVGVEMQNEQVDFSTNVNDSIGRVNTEEIALGISVVLGQTPDKNAGGRITGRYFGLGLGFSFDNSSIKGTSPRATYYRVKDLGTDAIKLTERLLPGLANNVTAQTMAIENTDALIQLTQLNRDIEEVDQQLLNCAQTVKRAMNAQENLAAETLR